jgi:hypothetical protein
MQEFFWTILLTILNIAIPYIITRYDRARLSPEQLARAWNGASWACALYFFGPLSLPAHFWVTRRKPLALVQGCLWTVLVFGCEWLVGSGLEQAFF